MLLGFALCKLVIHRNIFQNICYRHVLPIYLVVWLPNISQQTPGDDKYFNIIEKLHVDLLTSYNKQIRPVLKHTETLSVDVSPKPINIDYVWKLYSQNLKLLEIFYVIWRVNL